MIAFEVHVEELFLAEGLVAVAAGVRLLPGVRALVHDHVPLLKDSRCVCGGRPQSPSRGCHPSRHLHAYGRQASVSEGLGSKVLVQRMKLSYWGAKLLP